MSSYIEKCNKPIPIGYQRYAYQCEGVVFEPTFGAIQIRGYMPFNGGKEPYPNSEKDVISHYDLKISKFTANAIEIDFIKTFKDGSTETYTTNTSFSFLVNLLFEDGPANVFKQEAPPNKTINQ